MSKREETNRVGFNLHRETKMHLVASVWVKASLTQPKLCVSNLQVEYSMLLNTL